MDQIPVSEILPGLYRAVLDAVVELEAKGRRREAGQIRAEGTRIYSRAWTPDAARRLRALRSRADRVAGGPRRGRYEAVIDTIGQPAGLGRSTAAR